jgi:hypothetical protein
MASNGRWRDARFADVWDALVQSGSAANFAQDIESDAMYLAEPSRGT